MSNGCRWVRQLDYRNARHNRHNHHLDRGGVEWAIYNNWSIKGEYMFIGSGEGLKTCGFAAAPGGVAVSGGQFCFNHAFPGIHTAKFGLNYRFNSAGRDY